MQKTKGKLALALVALLSLGLAFGAMAEEIVQVEVDFGEYHTITADDMGISFDAPAYFGEAVIEDGVCTLTEPEDDIRSATEQAATVVVSVQESDATDAKGALESAIVALSEEYFTFTTSAAAPTNFLGETAYYVTYTLDVEDGDTPDVQLTGRLLAAIKDGKVYVVRTANPPEGMNAYSEGVFNIIRDTLKVL